MAGFCIRCGERARLIVPAGDNRERLVCSSCAHVHYENPKIVVGAVAFSGDRVLLCRRAIEPRAGFWTLPAGFLENGESVDEGTAREAREEASAELEIEALLAVYSLPHISQVQVLSLARLTDPRIAPGEESLDVGLFTRDEIPWGELAFPTVAWALERAFLVRADAVVVPEVRTKGPPSS